MGESRSDHPSKRQRSSHGIKKSSSEAKVAHGKGKDKGRKSKTKEKWPFIQGLTVDELARYRRRRVQVRPKDNLYPYLGSVIQDPASEYQCAFDTHIEEFSKENVWSIKDRKSEDYLHVEEIFKDAKPSYSTDFREYETTEILSTEEESTSSQLVNRHKPMKAETDISYLVTHETSTGRPFLIRRGTSLKCDGDFYSDTETFSAYIPYKDQHRPQLIRRPTSLKMEGDLDIITEKCEKFIEWLNISRPELIRIPTHLKMEGELETMTENQDKYVPFIGARRPELLRRSTNLKLEGATYFTPEYADVFKNYNVKDKPQLKKPQTQLRIGENLFQSIESTENCPQSRIKQMQHTVELCEDDNEEDEWIKLESKDQQEKTKKGEEMKVLVSKLEDLNGRPLEIPEYRDAYKDFPRERPNIVKPENEIGRADGSKVPSPSCSKFSTKIDQDPEYTSKYLDYPKDHPIYRKSPLILKPTITSSGHSSACFNTPIHQECKIFDYKLPTSEVKSQYVPYGHIPRVETLKMPGNLRLEGDIYLQPEYKNAYCTRDSRQICGGNRTYDRGHCASNVSRRTENFWLRDDNGAQCDAIVTREHEAFRVLNTRIRDKNVIEKSPPASQRAYKTSRAIVYPKPTQLDFTDSAVIKTRSPSPIYRLHVYDVDNEPHGFVQRKSLSHEASERIRSPSPNCIIQDDVPRPYSPSFGRDIDKTHHIRDQPFVVLDNAKSSSDNRDIRQGQLNRNVNVTISRPRRRPSTSSKWMPPWYDNMNTI